MARKMFKNLSGSQKTMQFLCANGFHYAEHRSKYVVFQSDTNDSLFLFVGKSGSIRRNHRLSCAGSWNVADKFKLPVLEWAKMQDSTQLVELSI